MKVFWSKCGHGHGNFGDKLTPLFLDLLNIRYQWVRPEESDLIGIGSLLEKIPEDYKGVVWSTGSMFEGTRRQLPRAKILAVRGALTARNLGLNGNTVLGDGGLLCHLFAEGSEKQFKLGIIPHFVDQQNRAVTELAARYPEIGVIDVCAPTLEVIEKVQACQAVISSSLHGLILADSLGVPNHWVEFSSSADLISGAGFKFRDYYSSFGLESMSPRFISGAERLERILDELGTYARPNIGSVKARLMDSLGEVASHFGRSIHDRISLTELRKKERANTLGRSEWNEEVVQLLTLLEQVVPPQKHFVLVDEEQIRAEVVHAPAIPLIEQDGEYWGAPLDDAHAIREAQRHRNAGMRHIAFTQVAYWWLQEYPEFARWLAENSQPVWDHETLKVFRFKQ